MLPQVPDPRPRFRMALLDQRAETPTALTFRFDRTGTGFEFLSNQAVRIVLPVTDPRGPSRLFSLSSSPTDRDWLAITSRMTGSPFKEALRALRPGDTVEMIGPLGRLFYDASRPAVMIAGGIGITPFHGMIRYAAATGARAPIRLLYSARTPEELAFRTELDELASRHPDLQVHYFVTRPQESRTPWTGRTGRIGAAEIQAVSEPLERPHYFVVGLPEMVVQSLAILQQSMGVPLERISIERFTGYAHATT